MKRKEWKKPLVAALTLAMALSGVAVSEAAPASADVAVSAKQADGAASGSSVTPENATGSAVSPEVEKIVGIMKKMEEQTLNLEEGQKMLIQKQVLTSEENQNLVFAQETLSKKNKKVKVFSKDLDGDGSPELLALYPNKKLEIYTYDMGMLNGYSKIKPVCTKKNVKEVRKQGKDKITLVISEKKGKKTTYTKYKYSFMKLKKKGKMKAKAFKKLKKVPFETPVPGLQSMYDYSDYLYATNGLYVVSTEAENSVDIYNNTVLRYDKDDKENPYKAFGGGIDNYRYVFGADAEKDWKSLVEKMTSLREFCAPIKIVAANSKNFKITAGEPQNGFATFNISPVDEDGSEADYFYRLIVDEKNSHLEAVEEWLSAGIVKERYDFMYGAKADYDGEIYEPGKDAEAYADPDYIKATGLKVRTLIVNYAGTKKEVKTASDTAFYFWSTTGKFSATIEGKEVPDILALKPGTHEHYMANELVNPSSGDVGYLDPTGEITWKPNLQ